MLNDDKPRLIQLLRHPEETGETAENAKPDVFSAISAVSSDGDGPCGATIEPGVAGRTAFTLRVQTGCAEPCSYCIIPATRGTPRSVPVDDVLREVERVVGAGFKEIALTGVHLGSYGRDLASRVVAHRAAARARRRCDAGIPRRRPLPHLLARADGLLAARSSISSRRSGRFAPHFHLPLQHASNRVLAAMRRPYTIEYYASLVDDIRARIPNASIGSDIIVGFPGETDEDFERACGYLERSPLTHVHVFPYSDRPGTPASAMAGKVARRRRSASAAAASATIGAAPAAIVSARRRSARLTAR